MSFFKSLSDNSIKKETTTAYFFIGSPEAEGETTSSSKMYIGEIFGDYLNVFPELDSEKFIVTGRKGSGKSAIAEFIHFKAKDEATIFSDFIKIKDIELNKLIQLGSSIEEEITEKSLFEWIILTKLTTLLIQDQSISHLKEIKDLKIFLDRNSGKVNITSYEIQEIIRNQSFSINIEVLKRVFKSLLKKDIQIKEHKAPFVKLIQPLKEVILKLFNERTNKETEYFLMFDDLDIGFKANSLYSINFITNILRTAKEYNNDLFGKNNIKAKIIVFLRDDIKRVIVNNNADTAKIFSSYEIPLIWYEHDFFKNNENSVALKKMINKRIEFNFIKQEIPYNKEDPWSSFIEENHNNKTDYLTFKDVLDYTFFRPRDLILFFKPLPTRAFKVPLSPNNIKVLIDLFATELVYEIKNELSAFFTSNQIEIIFTALKELRYKQPLTYENFIKKFEDLDLDYNHEAAITHIFDYSLIGNIDRSDMSFVKIFFKHREQYGNSCELNNELEFIYHKAITTYFDKNKR